MPVLPLYHSYTRAYAHDGMQPCDGVERLDLAPTSRAFCPAGPRYEPNGHTREDTAGQSTAVQTAKLRALRPSLAPHDQQPMSWAVFIVRTRSLTSAPAAHDAHEDRVLALGRGRAPTGTHHLLPAVNSFCQAPPYQRPALRAPRPPPPKDLFYLN